MTTSTRAKLCGHLLYCSDCQEGAILTIGNKCPVFEKDIVKYKQRNEKFGGPGKTVEVDETFLTQWKYHRGRRTSSMSIIIFGIYCREDKKGMFWRVPSKSKRDIWPLMKFYLRDDTSVICSDGAATYLNCPLMFGNKPVHKTVIHRERFRDVNDLQNHINAIECENRYLKREVISRKTTKAIDQYINWYIYKRDILSRKKKLGEKLHLFLQDMAKVYPGVVNWDQRLEVEDEDVELPPPEGVGITQLIPPPPAPGQGPILEPESDTEVEGDSDSDYVP